MVFIAILLRRAQKEIQQYRLARAGGSEDCRVSQRDVSQRILFGIGVMKIKVIRLIARHFH